jgi:hypothetical protein
MRRYDLSFDPKVAIIRVEASALWAAIELAIVEILWSIRQENHSRDENTIGKKAERRCNFCEKKGSRSL